MASVLDILRLTIKQGETFRLTVPHLRLEEGDCVCIAGESGCGKSSLLDVLALMAPPEAVKTFALSLAQGEALVALQDRLTPGRLHGCAELRSSALGYAPQAGGMLPFLTAQQDILSAIHLTGMEESTFALRLQRFAARLNMAADLHKRRSALSGGQRKRVSLLRAIAVPRRLLVLDEPTAGLDNTTGAAALTLLREIAQQERTACLIASHDVHLAQTAGFEVVLLAKVTSGAWRQPQVEAVEA